MAVIAGVDVTRTLRDATRGLFLRGSLTRITYMPRTSDDLTRDRTQEEVHSFEGLASSRVVRTREGTLTGRTETSVIVIAGSLPAGVVPEQSDQISIQGASGKIRSVSTDPGGGAYTCILEGE